ncbi:MAG: adenine phosphoribosyltransferase, partial [Candidatus Latescibacteria bacterium]|nr:adenine phosphoribosyltransferase [Candidatus Latescibacterota bacterium]
MVDLAACIRDIPDFPKPGILFKDITTLLGDPAALESAVQQLAEPYRGKEIDFVAAVESRGFIFGSCIARELEAGFIPIRKPGKLPAETISASYDLEYGTDSVEVHKDAIEAGQKVLLVDDLLATGGTMEAACRLVGELGGTIVGVAFLIELTFLEGRKKLEGYPVFSVVE